MTAKKKTKSYITHEKATIALFRNDPELAAHYLNQVLILGERRETLVALRRMAEAFGGVSVVATNAKRNVQSLYRTLSPKGNPELSTLTAVLRSMGLRLAVSPLPKRLRLKRRAKKVHHSTVFST